MPSEKVKDIGPQLEKILRDEAAQFLKDNRKDVAKLGEDVVLSILNEQIETALPAIPKLSKGASIEQRVELEEILTKRSRRGQLIAKAEAENSERVKRVRDNAIGVAGKVASAAGSVVLGLAFKALLGGG